MNNSRRRRKFYDPTNGKEPILDYEPEAELQKWIEEKAEVTSLNFPNLTTAELNSTDTAAAGDTYFDSDRGQFVRFTGPSSYDVITSRTEATEDLLPESAAITLQASKFFESGLVSSTDPLAATPSITIFDGDDFQSAAPAVTYLYSDGAYGTPVDWLDTNSPFGGAVTAPVVVSGKQYRLNLIEQTTFSFNTLVFSDISPSELVSVQLKAGTKYMIDVVAPVGDLATGNLRFDATYTGLYSSAVVQITCEDIRNRTIEARARYKTSEADFYSFTDNSKMGRPSPQLGLYTYKFSLEPSSSGVFSLSCQQITANAFPLLIDKTQIVVTALTR